MRWRRRDGLPNRQRQARTGSRDVRAGKPCPGSSTSAPCRPEKTCSKLATGTAGTDAPTTATATSIERRKPWPKRCPSGRDETETTLVSDEPQGPAFDSNTIGRPTPRKLITSWMERADLATMILPQVSYAKLSAWPDPRGLGVERQRVHWLRQSSR